MIPYVMQKEGSLLVEDNVISLRTAVVYDDGSSVALLLLPAPDSLGKLSDKVTPEFATSNLAVLYRHLKSPEGEEGLKHGLFAVERATKPISFDKPPTFKLAWTDSGHGVAIYLNGEPWAFICEKDQQGYSKGSLNARIQRLWDQELFEKEFLK